MPYRAILLVLLLAGLALVRYFGPEPAPAPHAPWTEGAYQIERVVDGDTILIEPHTRVRLIGINAPESVKPDSPVEAWGPEAADFAREFLAGGQARLTFDRERTDQYGRMLAYVWVDDRLLNEELLRRGLARFEGQYNYAEPMKRRFRAAQQQAQRERVGIWSNGSKRMK